MATSGQIRITPDQMVGRSKEYEAEGQAVSEVISKMDTLINELQSEWEGQASTEFANQFQELRPSFVKMHDLIETIAKQLYQTGMAMEQMDQDIANQFGVK